MNLGPSADGAPADRPLPANIADWISSTAAAAEPAAAAGAAAAPPALVLDRKATAEDMFDLAAAPVKPVVARFVPVDGVSKPLEFLHGDAVTVVGRSHELPVSHRIDSARLSAKHCEIRVEAGTNIVRLVDTSTNGVWVNGARVTKGTPLELNAGDTVRLLNPTVAVADGQPTFEYLFQQIMKKTTTSALVEDLTCSVCRSVYHKAVTVVPCLHSFCAACLSNWLKTGSQDCAECRTRMREVRPSHKLRSLVEELVRAQPELARGADERASLDAADTIPALGIVLSKRDRDGDDGGGSGSDDDYGEDDDEDSDGSGSGDLTPYGGGFGGGFGGGGAFGGPMLPMFFSAPPTSCAQCATPSGIDGFTCPPHQAHLRCYLCKTAFPHRPLIDIPQQCDLCNIAVCDLYLGGCKNPSGPGYLQPIGDHSMSELPLGSLFFGNTVEQGILVRYLATAKIDVPTVWALCLEKLKNREWVPDLTSVKGPIATSTVCQPCAKRVFAALLYHFRRAIPRDALPEGVTARSDCWYGLQCRTMKHNVSHAQAYNHVCPNVKRKE